jgi:hypothetical protein
LALTPDRPPVHRDRAPEPDFITEPEEPLIETMWIGHAATVLDRKTSPYPVWSGA